jgi:hypothetical protein
MFERGLVFEGISKVFDIACWKEVGKQTSIMKALEVASYVSRWALIVKAMEVASKVDMQTSTMKVLEVAFQVNMRTSIVKVLKVMLKFKRRGFRQCVYFQVRCKHFKTMAIIAKFSCQNENIFYNYKKKS